MVRTRVGYAGGTTKSPTYDDIGDHTETLQVDYDPDAVTYAALLRVFWSSHDPCRSSFSTQYKAVVFVHDDEQRKLAIAERSRVEVEKGDEVRTEIRDFDAFHVAEDYHQKYRLRSQPRFRRAMERIYPNAAAFRDSTVTARLNGWLDGHGEAAAYRAVRDRLGLPQDLLKVLDERFAEPSTE